MTIEYIVCSYMNIADYLSFLSLSSRLREREGKKMGDEGAEGGRGENRGGGR